MARPGNQTPVWFSRRYVRGPRLSTPTGVIRCKRQHSTGATRARPWSFASNGATIRRGDPKSAQLPHLLGAVLFKFPHDRRFSQLLRPRLYFCELVEVDKRMLDMPARFENGI